LSPVIRQHQVDDPAGKGRNRFVSYKNLQGYVMGDIVWGNTDGEKGEVDLATSNARLTLDF